MSIALVLGTRPEIVKMSPLIRECKRRSLDYFVLHTGQHYSYEMNQVFFEELELPPPEYNLDVGSGSHGEQTGRIMIGIEKILEKEMPNVVLVQGDTNTPSRCSSGIKTSHQGRACGGGAAHLRPHQPRGD